MNERTAALMAERAEVMARLRDQIDGLVRQLREAAAAKDQAVLAERERCARVAEELWLGAPLYAEGKDIAAVIRVGAKTK